MRIPLDIPLRTHRFGGNLGQRSYLAAVTLTLTLTCIQLSFGLVAASHKLFTHLGTATASTLTILKFSRLASTRQPQTVHDMPNCRRKTKRETRESSPIFSPFRSHRYCSHARTSNPNVSYPGPQRQPKYEIRQSVLYQRVRVSRGPEVKYVE